METMPHHWHEKCPNMGHPPSPFSFCFSVTKVTTVQPVCVCAWVCSCGNSFYHKVYSAPAPEICFLCSLASVHHHRVF